VELYENGDVCSKLITKSRFGQARISSGKTPMTRIKEHVSISFPKEKEVLCKSPPEISEYSASAFGKLRFPPEDECFDIPSDRLYSELVPFGPAYHNIKDILSVSEKGAFAKIATTTADTCSEPLGSPFPLDAAFHAACAWGQRFSGIVAFPVAFEKRFIFRPTSPNEEYVSRIVPLRQAQIPLSFDIWIYETGGRLCEAVLGVQMRDVSAGRMKPPGWLKG